MTTFTFDENTVSDLHKDAYGFRPTSGWFEMWGNLSDVGKQAEWDSLCEYLAREMEVSECREEAALDLLMKRIEETKKLGAADAVMALSWIIEAEDFSEHDLKYGADYFCYHFGISYAAKRLLPIEEAISATYEWRSDIAV